MLLCTWQGWTWCIGSGSGGGRGATCRKVISTTVDAPQLLEDRMQKKNQPTLPAPPRSGLENVILLHKTVAHWLGLMVYPLKYALDSPSLRYY